MTTPIHILTLTPIKKGRKYFTCSLLEMSYTVKLVIDGMTESLALDMPVAIRAKDQSRHSIFGSQIIYQAMQILRGQTTVADTVGEEIERSFQKASARGTAVDSSLGDQGCSWRSATERSLVQGKWDARRQNRLEARSWKFASEVLPKEVYEAMTKPGIDGVMEALMNDSQLCASMIDTCKKYLQQWQGPQKESVMLSVGICREGLVSGGYNKVASFYNPDTLWMRAAGIVVVAQLAEEAQVVIAEKALQACTADASAPSRRVRL